MCLHSVLNLSPVERIKKCEFSDTNKNENCTKIALGKNTILLGFRYSTLTFMSKRSPREAAAAAAASFRTTTSKLQQHHEHASAAPDVAASCSSTTTSKQQQR